MWTQEHDNWLINNVPKYHWSELTKLFNETFNLNCPITTIKGHCRIKLNLFNNLYQETYSEAQNEFIRSHSNISYKILTEMFNKEFNTNKTEDGIRHHAQKIGITFKSRHWWTEEEIEKLKYLYKNHTPIKDIEKELNLPVKSKIQELNIQRKRIYRSCDVNELEKYFKDNYIYESNQEIAEKFGINKSSKPLSRISKKYRNSQHRGLKTFIVKECKDLKTKNEIINECLKRFPNIKKISILQTISKNRKDLNRIVSDRYKIGHKIDFRKCIYVKTHNLYVNGKKQFKSYLDCYEKEYELVLGRKLDQYEKIIHLDGNYRNNDISNLRIISKKIQLQLNKLNWQGYNEITDVAIDLLKAKEILKNETDI